MAKDELSVAEKEVLQKHFGDPDFFGAMDHFLSIERNNWDQRLKNAAKAGAEQSDPVKRLMIINESAAKSSVYEQFFVILNSRTGVLVGAPTEERSGQSQ